MDGKHNNALVLYPVFGLTLLHHVFLTFNWPIPHLAMSDLTLVQLEIIAMSYLFGYLSLNWGKGFSLIYNGSPPTPNPWEHELKSATSVLFSVVISLLAFSTIFRMATMIRTPTKFYWQRFVFLGGCQKARPEYTPMRVLLNRSLARPLVNGESRLIIFGRAIILWCLTLLLPVAAAYYVIVVPLRTQDYARELVQVPTATAVYGTEFVILLQSFALNPVQCDGSCIAQGLNWSTVTVSSFETVEPPSLVTRPCVIQHLPGAEIDHTSVVCSASGSDDNVFGGFFTPLDILSDATFTISLQVTLGMGIRMRVVSASEILTKSQSLELESVINLENSPYGLDGWVSIVGGSSLFADLTWTQREVLTSRFAGLTESSHTIFTPQLSSVQPYPQGAAGGNLTSLTLISPYLTATRVLQEIRDADPVSGTSTLGGLWTFVDGVFATFFGANVVYFLLGRRHLSALGVAHIFQRGALTRRWHEDFPKLRTEGGKPGSEDAGIVAFIRQRLIDIDDPKTDDDDDDSLRTPSAMEMTPREGMVDDESEDNLKERLLSSGTPHALGRASTV